MPTLLPRNGLLVDIGSGDGPLVALRADLDALPVDDRTDDPWASTVKGVAHACGHDVHAAALLGAGLALAAVADRLPGRVRLIFQPAEEIMPGGALMAIEAGVLDGVSRIFGLHADPGLDVGTVGLREGPLTGAADPLDVLLTGKGGHTSRPHLTEDLTFALGKLVTELPAVLSRRLDPRAGVSVVWGIVRVRLGRQRHPRHRPRRRHRADARRGRLGRRRGAGHRHDRADRGALRRHGDDHLRPRRAAGGQRAPLDRAARQGGRDRARRGGHVATSQSLGGEDFAWYLESVPGAMGRLGTRTPGGPTYDLHQGDLRVDERADLGRRQGAGGRGARSRWSPTDNTVRDHRAAGRWRRPGSHRVPSRTCRGAAHQDRGGILRRFSKIAAVALVGALALAGCGSAAAAAVTAATAATPSRAAPTPARPPRATGPRSGSPTTSAAVVTSRSTTRRTWA